MSDIDIAWAAALSLAAGMPTKPHAPMNLLVFGQMLAPEEPICARMTEKSMHCRALKDFTALFLQADTATLFVFNHLTGLQHFFY